MSIISMINDEIEALMPKDEQKGLISSLKADLERGIKLIRLTRKLVKVIMILDDYAPESAIKAAEEVMRDS